MNTKPSATARRTVSTAGPRAWLAASKRLVLILTCGLLLCAAHARAALPSDDVRPGVYSFSTLAHFNASVFEQDFVRGVTLFVRWYELEPEKDLYRWHDLDKLFAAAAATGKHVNLQVQLGIRTPGWVYREPGVEEVGFARRLNEQQRASGVPSISRTPVPWNEAYLDLAHEFMGSIATRYAHRPELQYVMVNGPMVTAPEMRIPLATAQQYRTFREAGYDAAVNVAKWKESMARMRELFPEQTLTFAPAPVFHDVAPAKELMDHAHAVGSRAILLIRFHLNAKWFRTDKLNPFSKEATVDRHMIRSSQERGVAFGYQLFWFHSDEGEALAGDLAETLENGIQDGAAWLEVWQRDVLNPDFAASLRQADTRLRTLHAR